MSQLLLLRGHRWYVILDGCSLLHRFCSISEIATVLLTVLLVSNETGSFRGLDSTRADTMYNLMIFLETLASRFRTLELASVPPHSETESNVDAWCTGFYGCLIGTLS